MYAKGQERQAGGQIRAADADEPRKWIANAPCSTAAETQNARQQQSLDR